MSVNSKIYLLVGCFFLVSCFQIYCCIVTMARLTRVHLAIIILATLAAIAMFASSRREGYPVDQVDSLVLVFGWPQI